MNIIYKDDAIHYQQSVQSSQIFRFGRLPGETGLLARGCVVNTPMGHVLLTPGFDLVMHSGQGLQSILEGRMRTWLRNNINATYAARSFLAVNIGTNEVLLCFPADASQTCSKALVWNWKDNTFAVRDLSNVTYGSLGQVTLTDSDTWSGDTETWAEDGTTWGESDYAANTPRFIFTRTTPGLAMFDATNKDYGTNYTATIERIGMHFDAPEKVKLCRGVRPKIDASAGTVVSIQIGSAMVPDAAPTWQTAVDFTVGTDIEVHSFASGRFLALRMSTSSSLAWRVRSCQMDIVEQGAY
jgi:hypothetical protein